MAGATDPWTRYWSSGRLDACAADADGRYFPEIRDCWWRFFADLRPGAAVLDVATGNGAVLAIAAEYASAKGVSFDLVGVDQARPSPMAVKKLADRAGCALELHGGTPAEALPFEPGCFDAVTSQFALEYTDTECSLAGVARVLRPGGEFLMVGHREDSAVAAQTRVELDDAQHLLREAGMLDCLDALVAAEIDDGRLAALRRKSEAFNDAQGDFRREAAQVMERGAGRDPVQRRFLERVLANMGELYQHRASHPLDTVLAKFAELRAEVVAHGARLEDLLAASLSAEDRRALSARLEQFGFLILKDAPVYRADGAVLGHQLHARRG